MKHLGPAFAVALVLAQPGEVVPLAVEVIVVAIGQGGPDHLRHRIGDGPEAGLAGAQLGFGAHAVADIRLRDHGPCQLSLLQTDRHGLQQQGAPGQPPERLDLDHVVLHHLAAQRPRQRPVVGLQRLAIALRAIRPPALAPPKPALSDTASRPQMARFAAFTRVIAPWRSARITPEGSDSMTASRRRRSVCAPRSAMPCSVMSKPWMKIPSTRPLSSTIGWNTKSTMRSSISPLAPRRRPTGTRRPM